MNKKLGDFSQRHALKPLCELELKQRQKVFETAQLLLLEPRSLITPEHNRVFYLLQGQVNLLSGGLVCERFSHQQDRALSPLFETDQAPESALFGAASLIVSFDQSLLDKLYHQHQRIMQDEVAADLVAGNQKIFHHLLEAMQKNCLPIPDLPESALKIQQLIKQDSGTNEIIDVVQINPDLSARILMAVNSSLYGTWRTIDSIRDAVRRLGSETSRELCLCLSLKPLFSATHPLVSDQIALLYQESCVIASLAYAICRELGEEKFNPEKALLSGLLQNIGQVPVLIYFDEHPELIACENDLQLSVSHLQLPISRLLFKHWQLDESMLKIVKHTEDWAYQSELAEDYCDIIIAAKLLHRLHNEQLSISDLKQYPVIKKLKLLEQNEVDKLLVKIGKKQQQMLNILTKNAEQNV